jgi:hypothetical protein|nr:MAG TPA: hypothetical protein [Caudoviricetes sp.]
MNKYIMSLWIDGTRDIEKTKFEYVIGEIISIDTRDNLFKCIEVEKHENGDIYYIFKQGRINYDFNWQVNYNE